MSNAFNVFNIVGRVAKDANLRKNRNGSYSAFVSVANHKHYTDRNGNRKEFTNWLPLRKYLPTDNQAKFYRKLTTGTLINVTGEVKSHAWGRTANGYYKYHRIDLVPDTRGIHIISRPNSDKQTTQSTAKQSAPKAKKSTAKKSTSKAKKSTAKKSTSKAKKSTAKKSAPKTKKSTAKQSAPSDAKPVSKSGIKVNDNDLPF